MSYLMISHRSSQKVFKSEPQLMKTNLTKVGTAIHGCGSAPGPCANLPWVSGWPGWPGEARIYRKHNTLYIKAQHLGRHYTPQSPSLDNPVLSQAPPNNAQQLSLYWKGDLRDLSYFLNKRKELELKSKTL